MATHVDDLKSLHTILIDSKNGYEEALKDAEGRGLTGLFQDMISLRSRDIPAVAKFLPPEQAADADGSIMTTVNQAIMSIRSLFGGLDESVLPGLIDGEQRIVTYYDTALDSAVDEAERQALTQQRQNVLNAIAEMQRQHAEAA